MATIKYLGEIARAGSPAPIPIPSIPANSLPNPSTHLPPLSQTHKAPQSPFLRRLPPLNPRSVSTLAATPRHIVLALSSSSSFESPPTSSRSLLIFIPSHHQPPAVSHTQPPSHPAPGAPAPLKLHPAARPAAARSPMPSRTRHCSTRLLRITPAPRPPPPPIREWYHPMSN